MGELEVPRMLAVGSAMIAATAFRIGLSWLELTADHGPSLLKHGIEATAGGDRETAQVTFRDELVMLAKQAADAYACEVERGARDVARYTRPRDERAGEGPARPQRVKP
jgi:hypothetical protein